MKRILKFSNSVFDLIGFQEYNDKKTYRQSLYIIEKETNDGMLLYNTFTHEMLLLSNEEYEDLWKDNKYGKCNRYKYLIRHWFLIDESIDMKSICYMFNQIYKKSNKIDTLGKIKTYTIFATTNCNARCYYCYEDGCKKVNMSDKTAKDVVDYIKRTGLRSVNLNWFGGEPLCNSNAIDIIVNGLKEKNIVYSSAMTSNGYLFDKYSIDKLKNEWNLKRVQITLDGTEEKYNNIKNYVYINSNGFKKVTDNIEYLLSNDIFVNVRLNLSKDNIEDIKKLIEIIYERFNGYKNFRVYSKPLFEGEGNPPLELTKEEKEFVYNSYIEIQRLLRKNGLLSNYDIKNMQRNHCMADSKNSIVITPEGNLTLCEHHVDDEFIGSIYIDDMNLDVIQEWCKRYDISECESCVLYPQCVKIKKCPVAKCTEEYRKYTEEQIKDAMMVLYNNAAL